MRSNSSLLHDPFMPCHLRLSCSVLLRRPSHGWLAMQGLPVWTANRQWGKPVLEGAKRLSGGKDFSHSIFLCASTKQVSHWIPKRELLVTRSSDAEQLDIHDLVRTHTPSTIFLSITLHLKHPSLSNLWWKCTLPLFSHTWAQKFCRPISRRFSAFGLWRIWTGSV